jgi:GNAT superfamily N-acetyltransferase
MLRLLDRSDSALIQPVFDACEDYALMQDGQPFGGTAAALEFDEVPPGISTDAKRIFVIDPAEGPPIGIIEGLCGYPSPNILFLGLMLIIPSARSRGIGASALAELEDYVRSVDDCAEIELAVLKVNEQALRFWQGRGFLLRREAAATTSGQRTHERWVMGKGLRDA